MSFGKVLAVSALGGLVTLFTLANGLGVTLAAAGVIVGGKLIEKLSGNRGPLGLTEEEFEEFQNLKDLLDRTDGI